VAPVLGSASTHLATGLGGHRGRALGKGDSLEYGLPDERASRLRRVSEPFLRRLKRRRIRITAGPQADTYPREMLEDLARSTYTVTEASSRMGIRLSGAFIRRPENAAMVTEGASLGAIQVPPDCQPIILFVEHQTTGGYPKIANVISADMHAIGQLRPRDDVRFELVSLERAWKLLFEQEGLLRREFPHNVHE
jgi:allophanate hydrolase subunit 2